MSLEDILKSWGSPPSETEQQKMENAEAAIRKAIKSNATLADMEISIIRQGSYGARTNVRLDSDVDICVCLNSTFFLDYPPGRTHDHYGNGSPSISFAEFKNLLEEALVDYFGTENVTRGNKAFDIHSNTYRIDADVVPAFAYRFYSRNGTNLFIEPTGIAFNPDQGPQIINWPHQTYENGNLKQERTAKRYKKMVRILKKLRNVMQEDQIGAARDIGSFQIESAVWNVPDDGFNHETYKEDVRFVLAYCFNETLPKGGHANMWEVNNLKLLFGSQQPWTRERAHNFFSAAWDYIGFK